MTGGASHHSIKTTFSRLTNPERVYVHESCPDNRPTCFNLERVNAPRGRLAW